METLQKVKLVGDRGRTDGIQKTKQFRPLVSCGAGFARRSVCASADWHSWPIISAPPVAKCGSMARGSGNAPVAAREMRTGQSCEGSARARRAFAPPAANIPRYRASGSARPAATSGPGGINPEEGFVLEVNKMKESHEKMEAEDDVTPIDALNRAFPPLKLPAQRYIVRCYGPHEQVCELERIFGFSNGSGTNLQTCVRDCEWVLFNYTAAEVLASWISKIALLRDFTVIVDFDPEG